MFRVTIIMVAIVLASHVADAMEAPATYYDPPYTPSACFQNADKGVMVAGVSASLWNNRQACGQTYTVTCIRGANTAIEPCRPGASVTVTIVDFCSQCNGTLNLSRDAFAAIAKLNAGKVIVQF